VHGFTVDDPEKCGEVLREALSTPGPALVEAVVDPHEPPMAAEGDAQNRHGTWRNRWREERRLRGRSRSRLDPITVREII